MRMERVLVVLAAAQLLGGCHLFSKLNPDCHKTQDYQRASSAAPLKVPTGMDTPNTKDALTIPTVENAPPPPGPKDQCLDTPPRYKPSPTTKSGSASSG